jgi:hypothetical protein
VEGVEKWGKKFGKNEKMKETYKIKIRKKRG